MEADRRPRGLACLVRAHGWMMRDRCKTIAHTPLARFSRYYTILCERSARISENKSRFVSFYF